jgi:ATPase subunit of ABC transporter with duplicated ATPase domains
MLLLLRQPSRLFPQDFMNGVCTNIMHLTKKRLINYGGNYDAFIKVKAELEENQQKRYDHEQDQISHMKVSEIKREKIKKHCSALIENFYHTQCWGAH